MKPALVKWLHCVACKGSLDLEVSEQQAVSLSQEELRIMRETGRDAADYSQEILEGVLSCPDCRTVYPVTGGVPRMYKNADRDFAAKLARGADTRKLPGNKHEKEVQTSFSREWDAFDYEDDTIWLWTRDQRIDTFCEEVGIETPEELRGKLVVDAGCGPAVLSMTLAERHGIEIIGFDMSFIIGKAFLQNRSNLCHFIQGSVLSTPLVEELADLVYSHGVLHHTSSTQNAFEQVARHTKIGGMLYVWLYGKKKGWNRFRFAFIRSLRFIVSRLPGVLQSAAVFVIALVHAAVRFCKRLLGAQQIRYKTWSQFVVGIRDKYTPLYAREHTETEIKGWFSEAGYEGAERRTQWASLPSWNGSTDLAIKARRKRR